MSDYCCRLDQEFILGVVRNRSGIDSGEIDYNIRCHKLSNQSKGCLQDILSTLDCLKIEVKKEIALRDGFGWNYPNNCPSITKENIYMEEINEEEK